MNEASAGSLLTPNKSSFSIRKKSSVSKKSGFLDNSKESIVHKSTEIKTFAPGVTF